MTEWLPEAARYAARWLDHQMRITEQPGCVMAIARGSELLMQHAVGMADVDGGTPLTAQHRFRVASHSKTFTAAAVMLLRERGLLSLDDAVGRRVAGWNAAVSIVINAVDGPANQWVDGVLGIFERFGRAGATRPELDAWAGRWWSVWGTTDTVPMGDRVLLASPEQSAPFAEAGEIVPSGSTEGRIATAGGFGSDGELARLELSAAGVPERLKLGGTESLPEAAFRREIEDRRGVP